MTEKKRGTAGHLGATGVRTPRGPPTMCSKGRGRPAHPPKSILKLKLGTPSRWVRWAPPPTRIRPRHKGLQDNEVDEGNSSASSDDDVQISWRGLDTAEKAPNSQRCEEQFNTAKISPEDAWWRRDQQRQALSRVTEENTQQTSIRTSATSSRPIISSQRRTATQPYRPQLQSIKQVQSTRSSVSTRSRATLIADENESDLSDAGTHTVSMGKPINMMVQGLKHAMSFEMPEFDGWQLFVRGSGYAPLYPSPPHSTRALAGTETGYGMLRAEFGVGGDEAAAEEGPLGVRWFGFNFMDFRGLGGSCPRVAGILRYQKAARAFKHVIGADASSKSFLSLRPVSGQAKYTSQDSLHRLLRQCTIYVQHFIRRSKLMTADNPAEFLQRDFLGNPLGRLSGVIVRVGYTNLLVGVPWTAAWGKPFMLLPARSSLIHTDVWRAEGGLLAQFVRSSYMPPLEIMDFVNKEAILVWPGGPLPVDGPSRSLLCMPEPQQPDPPAHAVSKVAPAVTVRAALSCPGMSLSDSEDDGW